MKELAIKVEHVSKDFILPHDKVNTIKGSFTNMLKQNRKEVQHALKDINFEIKKGEFFGIVGRNGSGKSTLLKILASIYQPTKGSVFTSGKLVPFIELGVGFNPELSGKENVYLNGSMLGFTRKEIAEMYDDIVAFAELNRFMDQKLKNYSSGMQVRLAFSMATRAHADILVVDEVLAVGDADFQRKCFNYFKKLKKDKRTVVFVTHDMGAVREYCDRAILIENSEIISSGSADKVATEYTRMFNTDDAASDGSAVSAGDISRWGNKDIEYIGVTVPKHVSGKRVTIDVTFKANKSVGLTTAGFKVKSLDGQDILGTNTKIKRKKIGPLIKDDIVNIKWEIPNIFADGKYTVDVAVENEDNKTMCDWWEDATSFVVFKEERSPYVISPDINLTINTSKT